MTVEEDVLDEVDEAVDGEGNVIRRGGRMARPLSELERVVSKRGGLLASDHADGDAVAAQVAAADSSSAGGDVALGGVDRPGIAVPWGGAGLAHDEVAVPIVALSKDAHLAAAEEAIPVRSGMKARARRSRCGVEVLLGERARIGLGGDRLVVAILVGPAVEGEELGLDVVVSGAGEGGESGREGLENSAPLRGRGVDSDGGGGGAGGVAGCLDRVPLGGSERRSHGGGCPVVVMVVVGARQDRGVK